MKSTNPGVQSGPAHPGGESQRLLKAKPSTMTHTHMHQKARSREAVNPNGVKVQRIPPPPDRHEVDPATVGEFMREWWALRGVLEETPKAR